MENYKWVLAIGDLKILHSFIANIFILYDLYKEASQQLRSEQQTNSSIEKKI